MATTGARCQVAATVANETPTTTTPLAATPTRKRSVRRVLPERSPGTGPAAPGAGVVASTLLVAAKLVAAPLVLEGSAGPAGRTERGSRARRVGAGVDRSEPGTARLAFAALAHVPGFASVATAGAIASGATTIRCGAEVGRLNATQARQAPATRFQQSGQQAEVHRGQTRMTSLPVGNVSRSRPHFSQNWIAASAKWTLRSAAARTTSGYAPTVRVWGGALHRPPVPVAPPSGPGRCAAAPRIRPDGSGRPRGISRRGTKRARGRLDPAAGPGPRPRVPQGTRDQRIVAGAGDVSRRQASDAPARPTTGATCPAAGPGEPGRCHRG